MHNPEFVNDKSDSPENIGRFKRATHFLLGVVAREKDQNPDSELPLVLRDPIGAGLDRHFIDTGIPTCWSPNRNIPSGGDIMRLNPDEVEQLYRAAEYTEQKAAELTADNGHNAE